MYVFVGAKVGTLILGLEPHLLMGMRPRSKRLGRSQNKWSRQEWVEVRGPRGSSSGPDEYQSSWHSGDLGNLPGDSNNEDRLQARTEVIKIQKYLREKLPPPH